MNKWLRWQGALGFVVVTGGLLSIGWFFLDNWIHYAIENEGSALVGAKVELEEVHTSLSPLGIELVKLQIADPDKPFQNMVQIRNIQAYVEPLYLLMGQAIIEEAELSEMRFGTQRESSGLLSKRDHKDEKKRISSAVEEALEEVGFEMPSVDSVLEKEKLDTERKAEALESLYKQCEQIAKDAQQAIPDKKSLKEYEDRLQTIFKGKIISIENYKQRKAKLKKLKAELRAIKQQLEDAKKDLLSCRENFNNELKALRTAPKEDVKRLKEKYQISDQGAGNFARLLFGETAENWINEALAWYEKFAPVLLEESEKKEAKPERFLGQNIHYPDVESLPDFLIRISHISIITESGIYTAEVKDITHQQDVLGRPITLHVTGNELKNFNAFDLIGSFDHRKNAEAKDTLVLNADGFQIKDEKLASVGGNNLLLSEATAVLVAEATYQQSNVDLVGKMEFNEARFTGGGSSGLGKQLGLALAKIDKFKISASAKGEIKDLNINLKSDLDKKIGDAISARFDEQKKEFAEKLEKKINNQLKAFLAKNNVDHNKFNIDVNNLSTTLDKNRVQLENMLEKELEDFETQNKRELEAKKAAEKERLKRRAEKELKEKLNKLKLRDF